jgi:hypothetical protein
LLTQLICAPGDRCRPVQHQLSGQRLAGYERCSHRQDLIMVNLTGAA